MQPCRGLWLIEKTLGIGEREMTEDQKKKLMGIAMAGAAVYVAWRFAPSQTMKAMALGVGGVIVAKQLPYVRDALV